MPDEKQFDSGQRVRNPYTGQTGIVAMCDGAVTHWVPDGQTEPTTSCTAGLEAIKEAQ